MPRGQRIYVGPNSEFAFSAAEKSAVTAACEKVIAEVYLPQYLAEITPTDFNYPIAIYGKWHGKSYRFITRYRSPFKDAIAPEFDAPFSRIEFVSRNCYDLSFFRHTERWHTLHRGLTLNKAIAALRDEPFFHPHC